MSSIQFKKVPLWGGNMNVQVPSSFVDASDLRPIPDHQEVWVDGDGPASIIFSINQRVDVPLDEDALSFHLEDQVEEDSYRVWANKPIIAERFPSTTRGRYLVATVKNRKTPSVQFSGIILIMFRLQEYETDLVITLTIPHTRGQFDTTTINLPEGKLGPLMESADMVRDAIAQTLECPDFSFLVKEENKDEVMSD